MHALIPLLLIFIALNGEQLKTDKLYRANVFAIVGIFYFVFLQYIYYWSRVFPVEGWMQFVPAVIAVLVAVGVSLSPWGRRSHPIKTAALCSLFVISLCSTYAFDMNIKEWLSEKGGFYNGQAEVPLVNKSFDQTHSFQFHSIGLEVQASEGWSKAELPSGHEYLFYEVEGELRLEARPNCLNGVNVDTPTYISNILMLLEVDNSNVSSSYQCEKSGELKECLIKANYSSKAGDSERWHWLVEQGNDRAIVIDFLMADSSEMLKGKAVELMASTKLMERRKAEICHTPAAWL